MCEWNRNLIIQDIVLAIVINTSATLLGGDPFDHTWYIFTCVALATNVLGQLLLPTGSWACALTDWAGGCEMARLRPDLHREPHLRYYNQLHGGLGAHWGHRRRRGLAFHVRAARPRGLRDVGRALPRVAPLRLAVSLRRAPGRVALATRNMPRARTSQHIAAKKTLVSAGGGLLLLRKLKFQL